MARISPPKPASRPDRAGPLQRLRLFRADMFRSQPDRLYRAKMAEMRTPLVNSYLLNTPDLVNRVLVERPQDFPKADLIGQALAPLLGRSVFVTNGTEWQGQRRIIDPAFAAGRLREAFPAMRDAGEAGQARLADGRRDIEFDTAHIAADVIFRTLFSIPITEARAAAVFAAFQTYQRTQPLLSPAALLGLWRFWPGRAGRRGRRQAGIIRDLLGDLVAERARAIAEGTAPNDLATEIMTRVDPDTGKGLDPQGVIDQVAIFFLAGHETSASALSWALYCLAADRQAQAAVLAEVEAVAGDRPLEFADIARLRFTRDVFRETLRLYPPVPMMVRAAARPETFRDRHAKRGSLCILSPWHMQRHRLLWSDPDVFDPWRWASDATRETARDAYLPFSKGPRVCSGAGFAMLEGVLLLAMLVRRFDWATTDRVPVPVAHLTVRAEDGIHLSLSRREPAGAPQE